MHVLKVLSGCNVIVWGAILMLQASTTHFGAFFALRFLLGESSLTPKMIYFYIYLSGMCESCVAPILILIISMFYKKDEQVSAASISPPLLFTYLYLGESYIMVLCHGEFYIA